MRKFNFIFLAALLALVTVLGGGMHLVRGFQMRRNASALLDRARSAEAGQDPADAEKSLTWYLNLLPEDGPTWAWYARVVDERDADHRQPDRVFLVHEEALRHTPGDSKLERRCADLALGMRRYNDAQRHLTGLLDKVPQGSQGQPAAAELAGAAELEDLLGQCARGLTRYEDAEGWFQKAIKHDPGRVACYERLAWLQRRELRQSEPADGTINEMVAKNPKAGQAYIYHRRYLAEFPPADVSKLRRALESDLEKALELAPEDAEVLLTAATASEQKNETAAARRYFEKGVKLHPKNSAFALGLARLETRELHMDRAEAVLRQAYQANPAHDVTFALAQNLIAQKKIDGTDQAGEYIARLRNLGFGDNLVRFLEAEIPFTQENWVEAISRIEMARAVLGSEPQFTAHLNLMLAECYRRVGSDEQRLDALRRAAEGDQGPQSARIELAQALASSGKLDQAVTILSPLAMQQPEWRLDRVNLLIQKTSRQPRGERKWQEVEQHLREAKKALPQAVEKLTLLEADLLAGQERLEDARSLLSSAHAKDPRNLRYRLALARLNQRQGNGDAALQVIDAAEKDLGPSPAIATARLVYWSGQRGDEAKAAVAKLAASRKQIPVDAQAAFLDTLVQAEIRLGEPALAQQHLSELEQLQPTNPQVLEALFDLALQAGHTAEARILVDKIHQLEGEKGALWRFAQASMVIDHVRRGETADAAAPHRPDADAEVAGARVLAAEIAAQRPDWWGSFALLGQIAERDGQTDEAIKNYTRAIDLGNSQRSLAGRLVGLLNQKSEFNEIDRVVKVLSERGVAAGDLTISTALNLIRQKDYERGITLARQVFAESSTNYADHLYMGRIYVAARRPIEAGKELRRAVELGPGAPLTWMNYVQYLVEQKQVDQAKAAIAAARQALPADRANLVLAQCYSLVGDTKQADALIQAALQSPACDLTTIQVATELYINQGRFDQVEPILEKLRAPAIKVTPEVLAWANRTRGLALQSTGRLAEMDRALALVDQNLKANPSNLEDQRLKAVLLAQRTSRRGDAIKLLEALDQSKHLGANEQFTLAKTYLAERLVDKYKQQMIKLLGSGVTNPRHLAHFIAALIDRQELEESYRWLAELRRIAPQSLTLLELEARLLDLRQRQPELLALLLARLRQSPGEIRVVAGLLERFGFAKEAEAAYNAYAGRNSDEPERALGLASFLARQDRTKEAVAILDQAWKTCRPEAIAAIALELYMAPSADDRLKRRVEAWVAEAIRKSPAAAAQLRPRLATIYFFEQRYDEVETVCRQVLASDPDNVEILNILAWELALRERGSPGEALELVNRAIEKRGRTSSLVDTRAVALIQAGEPDRAAREIGEAQAVDPRNVSLALHLAWAYQAAGNVVEARKALRYAQELGLKPATRDPLERGIIDRLRGQLATDQPPPPNRG